MFVARSRRRVYQQVVCLAPSDIGQKLFDHGRLLGTSPHNRVAWPDQKTQTHDAQRPTARGTVGIVYFDWQPTVGTLGNATLFGDSKHVWDVGTSEIDIQNADRMARLGEREGKLCGDRRLAYSSFA